MEAIVEQSVFLVVEVENGPQAQLLREEVLVVELIKQGPPGPPGDFGGVLDGGNF